VLWLVLGFNWDWVGLYWGVGGLYWGVGKKVEIYLLLNK
jgi:hypothetical protein